MRKLSTLDLTLTHDVNHDGADAYGVHGIPHRAIIDRSGRIVRVNRGDGEDELGHIGADLNRTLQVQRARAAKRPVAIEGG